MTKPKSLHPLAEGILNRLAQHEEAAEIVLGGYFALQHYADYRQTHDIAAWWKTRASTAALHAIRTVMTEIAAANGLALEERSFGDTVSFESPPRESKRVLVSPELCAFTSARLKAEA